MNREHVAPSVAQAARELRRALDVTEAEGERSARPVGHPRGRSVTCRVGPTSGSGKWKRGVQPVAALWPGARIELAAVDGHPLAHADKAVPALLAAAVTEAVVADRQLDTSVAV